MACILKNKPDLIVFDVINDQIIFDIRAACHMELATEEETGRISALRYKKETAATTLRSLFQVSLLLSSSRMF